MALKSDKEFVDCDIYSKSRSEYEEKCEVSIEELINKARLGLFVRKVASYFSINEIKDAYKKIQSLSKKEIAKQEEKEKEN
ncbi:MAG: hypothetical protein J6C46_09585 [Clostridia bacterium]|nr:hypothetical protein [Clostridia bacterium]